ncbi:MAG: 6,7-dimethyl-8-ribityllumazine synthase [Acidobacteriota bacterium]|nr:MAG: 6,7-dimethyl-8-ribityllumazine synthase [Acidobacteriota bacterium]
MRFAVVVARWNRNITSQLEAGAIRGLTSAGCAEEHISIFAVPGAFELPLACKKAADTRKFDAVIALGCVIRGDTPHFDFVAGEAARGLMDVSLETGVPVIFGVITTEDLEQAIARAGDADDPHNKGNEAAVTAIEMAHICREISDPVQI